MKIFELNRQDEFLLNGKRFKFFKVDGMYAQVKCLSNEQLDRELAAAYGGVVLFNATTEVEPVDKTVVERRFYADVVNHHNNFYAVFDSLTKEPAEGDMFAEYANLPLDFSNEFGYANRAQGLAEQMNVSHQAYIDHVKECAEDQINA